MDQIVVVDKYGATHKQPARNRKNIENRNKYYRPEDRPIILKYDPAHPEMEYYLAKARQMKSPAEAGESIAVRKQVERAEKAENKAIELETRAKEAEAKAKNVEKEYNKALSELEKLRKLQAEKETTQKN